MKHGGPPDIDPRWLAFVEANDYARETLRLADAAAAGRAFRAWCTGADVPLEPLSELQLTLWRQVIEWKRAVLDGMPGASGELCVARGRFVHSFYVRKEKGGADGQGQAEARQAGQAKAGVLELSEGAGNE